MLLLDIGNSRLKWAETENGRIVNHGAVVHEGKPADALSTLALDEPEAIWVANVTGPAHELTLNKVVLARWQQTPRYARSEATRLGLVNGYARAQSLGVDRWLVMLAAWSETNAELLVADAGTALTVDGIDAGGRHLGGFIAAGLNTSEKAVLGATRFPARDTPLTPQAGFGLDTERCVRQGAMLSCLGALDRAAGLMPIARRLITGGDAPALISFLDKTWECRPHLVFEGLMKLASASG